MMTALTTVFFQVAEKQLEQLSPKSLAASAAAPGFVVVQIDILEGSEEAFAAYKAKERLVMLPIAQCLCRR